MDIVLIVVVVVVALVGYNYWKRPEWLKRKIRQLRDKEEEK